MKSLKALQDFFIEKGVDKTYWVAYSGGLDSHVLLALCSQISKELPLKIHAIHVHHGLSPHADSWAAHCEKTCHELEIPFIQKRVTLNLNAGASIEEVARAARYQAFISCLNTDDVLLTAHHQDDQAETYLMQLLRGAGPKGLAAMPLSKPLGKGLHVRPLLSFSREELQTYAEEINLHWIEDESNANSKFARNFLRNEILPLLKNRWPSVSETICRSALHCANAQAALDELISDLYESVQGNKPDTLSVTKLQTLKFTQQSLVLRYWIEKQGYLLPNAKKLTAIQQEVLTAAIDRKPCVSWGAAQVRRFRDDIYLLPHVVNEVKHQASDWQLAKPLALQDKTFLHAIPVQGEGLCANINTVSVRFRESGDSVFIAKRGRLSLKNLFQEWGVPPWERESLPLIFINETLIAAVDYFLDKNYQAKANESGYQLVRGPLI